MHAHAVTREGLIKLPLIFAAIGALSLTRQDVPSDAAAAAYIATSLGLSVGLGIWRGAVIHTWMTADGTWMSKGNRLTISLWILLIGAKFAMGALAGVTGWFPASSSGEVFLFLGISFAVQNLVVASRTLGPARSRRRRQRQDRPVARMALGVVVRGRVGR